MKHPLKLTCILAHPDDESMGTGGILAKYADEGVHTTLITATGGERGWFGPEDDYPGPQALARTRQKELRAAADVLGLQEVSFLGYEDGQLDQADPAEVVCRIVDHLRRVRPQVVVTFDPFGAYGHPDHVAICQLTTSALVAAADAGYDGERPPHRVSKLYYMAQTQQLMQQYEAVFGELVMDVDDVSRRAPGWESWAITTRIDTVDYWRQIVKAIACHKSQLPAYDSLYELPEEDHRRLWKTQSFYRAYSLVNGGRDVEKDLFAGLRERKEIRD